MKDSESGESLAFVNVGVLGTDIGTITGPDGRFSLSLSEASDHDTLRCSHVGYRAFDLSVGSIRKDGFSGDISLEEVVVELEEVRVTSDNLVSKVLGIPKEDCYPIPFYKKATSNIPFPQPSYRHEIGTFFENDKTIYLDSIHLNFTNIQIDTVRLRVNIYLSEAGDLQPILAQPLYISFSHSEETQRIDLSHLSIPIDRDFLISIENYRRVQDNSLSILANLKSKGASYPTYYRRNTHSPWIKLQSKARDFGISFIAYIRQ